MMENIKVLLLCGFCRLFCRRKGELFLDWWTIFGYWFKVRVGVVDWREIWNFGGKFSDLENLNFPGLLKFFQLIEDIQKIIKKLTFRNLDGSLFRAQEILITKFDWNECNCPQFQQNFHYSDPIFYWKNFWREIWIFSPLNF